MKAIATTDAPVPTRWLRLDEAAKITQVSTATLRREINRGRLRHARVGGRRAIRLRPEWLDLWLEQTTTPIEVGLPNTRPALDRGESSR
jgi:excisionase family DNA binding protein